MLAAAGVGRGDPVLEVGCGTGQLTRRLVTSGCALTAVDLGPAMVARARRNVPDGVTFVVSPFEDLDVPPSTYQLIVSATAFHWIDPEVGFARAAQRLRPGGWLAVLTTGESYDEPVGTTLRGVWVRHVGGERAWKHGTPPSVADGLAGSGLFEPAVVREVRVRATLPAENVFRLEHTRATSLGFDEATRAAFGRDLRAALDGTPEVGLDQLTNLMMARVLAVNPAAR